MQSRTGLFRIGYASHIAQGQCLALGMSFSERTKNLLAGHLRPIFYPRRHE